MGLFIYIYLVCGAAWGIISYGCFYYVKYKFEPNIKLNLFKLIFGSLFWPITVLGTFIKILMEHLAK